MKDKLLIFDMDNTLLQSKIDFARMTSEVTSMLSNAGFAKYAGHSVATSLVNFAKSADYDEQLTDMIWQRVSEIEADGLYQAVLEPGVCEALAYLSEYAELSVLSNNRDAAVEENLERLGVSKYLSTICGRDSVPFLKPAPDGMLYVKSHYPEIILANTLTIGDAIIDAEAAAAAGIGFVSYNRSRAENWQKWGIEPLLTLHSWNEDACQQILRLW